MSTWRVIKGGEYPKVEFTHIEDGIECDHCHQIVPVSYTESFFGHRDGHHDGREGRYVVCRDVWGFGTGKVHNSCRG